MVNYSGTEWWKSGTNSAKFSSNVISFFLNVHKYKTGVLELACRRMGISIMRSKTLQGANTLWKEECRYAQFGNKLANCGAGTARPDTP